MYIDGCYPAEEPSPPQAYIPRAERMKNTASNIYDYLTKEPPVNTEVTIIIERKKRHFNAPSTNIKEDSPNYEKWTPETATFPLETVFGGIPSLPKSRNYMNPETAMFPIEPPIVGGIPSLPKSGNYMANFESSLPGVITLQVAGGITSLPKSRTYMALIGYGDANGKEWGCGGSLITSKYVLSAAHCAAPPLLGPAKWARLGELDLSTTTDDAKVQDLAISERIIHPGYREPEVYNDIAIFKLASEASFTQWVAPVCLQTAKDFPEVIATVTGWGRVDFAGGTSEKLLEADLDIFNSSECRRLLPFVDTKTPKGIDPVTMVCAGKRDGTKDSCSGDSGGPLVLKDSNSCLKTQIGVTSYGNMCGLPDSPGVYTRVSAYLSWIEKIAFQDI